MESLTEWDKGILLDRDGVLLEDRPDYVKSIAEVKFLPDVEKAVAKLWKERYSICVVTNQAGIAKGLYSGDTLREIHLFIEEELHKKIQSSPKPKIHWYFCPHRDEDKCRCRKPEPGMLVRAMDENRFCPGHTWMVGDSARDIVAGIRAGCHTAIVKTGQGERQSFPHGFYPQAVFPNLLKFVETIIADGRP